MKRYTILLMLLCQGLFGSPINHMDQSDYDISLVFVQGCGKAIPVSALYDNNHIKSHQARKEIGKIILFFTQRAVHTTYPDKYTQMIIDKANETATQRIKSSITVIKIKECKGELI